MSQSTPHRPIQVAVGRRPGPSPGDRGPEPTRAPGSARPGPPPTIQTPPIDIFEDAEGLILEADVPGVSEDSIDIHLEDNLLSLRAEVRSTVPEEARPLRLEYPLGTFQRTFILSDEVDRSRISAELRAGVLRLTLPRAERSRTRRIEIKSHDG